MSNAPWAATGYGQQTALVCSALRDLGHEVKIYAYIGLQGAPLYWNGIEVLPRSHEDFGLDILPGHIEYARPDVIVVLCDAWVLDAEKLARILDLAGEVPMVHWLPVDVHPLAAWDKVKFAITAGRRWVVPMTEHGRHGLLQAGLDPLPVIPHGIDLDVFTPLPDDETAHAAIRRSFGLDPQAFIVGMNAANMDERRKGVFEQCRAFARFRKRHPGSVLLLHMLENTKYGQRIGGILDYCGLKINEHAVFTSQWHYAAGTLTPPMMADWYRCVAARPGGGVLAMASYGEGFGLPLIEAAACGLPVITTKAAPMRELAAPGSWLAECQEYYASVHEACWHVPFINSVDRQLEQAWRARGHKQRARSARAHAEQFAIGDVAGRWHDVLQEVIRRCATPRSG